MTTHPDPFGRPPVTDAIKAAIKDAFSIVPTGRESAVIFIFDEHGGRIHAAWRATDHWEVGAVLQIAVGAKPSGTVMVVGSW